MDLADVATYFDSQPFYDAYTTTTLLGYGQPDLFDTTERDSATGFRRTMSVAPSISPPTRGCIKVASDYFIVGRTIRDFFQGAAHRAHWVLHPADSLMQVAMPSVFLAAGTPTSLYGALSWIKDLKDEGRTSELIPGADFYSAAYETITVGSLVKDANNDYHRIVSIGDRSGMMQVALTYKLGAAIRAVTYTPGGSTYSPTDNAYSAGTPITPTVLIEDYKTNYFYRTNAAEKFERSDKVVTILKSAVATPKTTDKFVDSGTTYRVLESYADDANAWALHVRPI